MTPGARHRSTADTQIVGVVGLAIVILAIFLIPALIGLPG
jgi:hypothetical protein